MFWDDFSCFFVFFWFLFQASLTEKSDQLFGACQEYVKIIRTINISHLSFLFEEETRRLSGIAGHDVQLHFPGSKPHLHSNYSESIGGIGGIGGNYLNNPLRQQIREQKRYEERLVDQLRDKFTQDVLQRVDSERLNKLHRSHNLANMYEEANDINFEIKIDMKRYKRKLNKFKQKSMQRLKLADINEDMTSTQHTRTLNLKLKLNPTIVSNVSSADESDHQDDFQDNNYNLTSGKTGGANNSTSTSTSTATSTAVTANINGIDVKIDGSSANKFGLSIANAVSDEITNINGDGGSKLQLGAVEKRRDSQYFENELRRINFLQQIQNLEMFYNEFPCDFEILGVTINYDTIVQSWILFIGAKLVDFLWSEVF